MTQALQQTYQEPAPAFTPPQGGELDQIVGAYKKDLALVNKIIAGRYENSLPLVNAVGRHHFQAGGKRVRPLLTLIIAGALGVDREKAANLAACVELIHGASLLHDDVLDESDQRRGRPSTNAVWGNRVSILAGDFLFSQAFSCMVSVGVQEVYGILAWASATITQGELRQISIQRDLSISMQEYEQVIEEKTAALFQAAAQLPGCLLTLSQRTKEALATFGLSFGRIFQFVDDFLDYMGNEAVLGKRLGADLQEGKATFPVLVAYQAGTGSERAFWQQLFVEGAELKHQDSLQVRALIKKYDGRGALDRFIEKDYRKALSALEALSPSPHKEALVALLAYIRHRQS